MCWTSCSATRTFARKLDQSYRQRALDSHLRAVPVFAELTDEFIEGLREKVELLRFTPGQVICRQGEAADSFYLVRIGFVKVSQTHPGGEMVLAYLSRGEYFGETGLLEHTCAPPRARRSIMWRWYASARKISPA